MVELQAITNTGANTMLSEESVEEFRTSLRGQLIFPGEPGYDEARTLWNAQIDKHPALIARCAGVSDVIGSVKFARANNLLVAVRGGGHSFPGKSVCDGGLMIDLSSMKGVGVDPNNRTARAEPGVKWIDFDVETQAFGLATTVGTVSDTGIAGLTLGGGFGWLMGKHGMTVDNLISADVVTADGQLLTANANENQDLFWGLRGGGGNLGVVTSFEYRLYPVGPVFGGMLMYPIEKAGEAFKIYHDFASAGPEELITAAALLTSPEGAPVAAIAACYPAPVEQGEKVLQPLREFGPPMADMMGPVPYHVMQTMLDPAATPGNRYYINSGFVDKLDGKVIDTMVERYSVVPSPLSFLLLFRFGGAARRVPKDETAYFHRDAIYDFEAISAWLDPADDEKNIRWSQETWDAVRPFATGAVYVNGLQEEGEDRVRAAYGATTYDRLVELKNKYDPTNLFRLNQNIKPTVG